MPRRYATPILLPGDPTNALEASTKQYVDAADGQRALDTAVVHNSGNETILGQKTIPSGSGNAWIFNQPVQVAVGTIASHAVRRDDSRLSDARTPTAHASSHATGQSDALSPSAIGAEALANKGANNGYCPLDSNGLVPVSDLPSPDQILGIGNTRISGITSAVSRTSNTTLIDTGIIFNNLPGPAWYGMDGLISYQAGTTGDLKLFFGNSNVSTISWQLFAPSTSATTNTPANWDLTTRSSLSSAVAYGGVGSFVVAQFRGMVQLSATGILGLQFAQNTSDTTATTIFAGSHIRLTRFA